MEKYPEGVMKHGELGNPHTKLMFEYVLIGKSSNQPAEMFHSYMLEYQRAAKTLCCLSMSVMNMTLDCRFGLGLY